MRILLVDDDEALVELLTKTLAQQNYALDVATDGEQGWIYGSTYTYDLIILDWSLPKLDGIQLCQRFRAHDYDTPIILLTSRSGSQNKIRGLDAGADDYICKPFDVEELAARIRALLRRLTCDFLPILHWGDLKLNPCTSEVIYQGQSLFLTAKEYRLLELFLRHSQEVFSVEDIIDRLWSSTEYPAIATVRSHLRRLRQKLKEKGFPDNLITTVRGQGYCLRAFPEDNNVGTDERQTTPNTASVSPEQPNKRSQHIAALTSIWSKHQSKREQQLAILAQAIAALDAGNLEISDRLSAIITAHTLAGNLGQFGLDRASELAKDIEQLLQEDFSQDSNQLLLLSHKFESLRQELALKQNIVEQISQKFADNLPLLLIIGEDEQFIEQLSSEAIDREIRTKTISTPEKAKHWLEEKQIRGEQLPHAVVLKVFFAEDAAQSPTKEEYLGLIAEFKLLTPSIPVIVIADRDRFEDRLLVARHGGKFYLTQPVNPKQVITVCQKAAQYSSLDKKIMIVDDDIEFLQTLPTLLKPWGFKLTTLDDPRQFWDVLQAVAPDLLVLDIEMPHRSGIELCKVLRTHSYWCKLPVLFLSIHRDDSISTEVFASGANDLVIKPVLAQQLANRILNRLNLKR
ncbi:transcriptional regulator [Pleurocapsa sp. CCALA 161]|uniref:response regulator n=1 Tax=Pleurocapsa sp. CCALA 161 TaxID=2107688 RepID=UPI000D084A3B|nr:response regulator [Pleurocapsa sp. CCALA 161]PSB12849.1 transcriptional regulator [Pleurocapsa sp. CCALA 161]